MEFDIKIWEKFRYKMRKLIIRRNDFQIKKIPKDKKKKKKENDIKTYSLSDAIVLDQSNKSDIAIFIANKDYKLTITPLNLEDKAKIMYHIDKIIKKFTFQNVYKDYNEKMTNINDKDNEITPQDFLTARLFLFKNLLDELNQKIEEFKPLIKQKPKTKSESEMLRLYTNINAIKEEMESQFQVILTYTNNYFDLTEKYKKGTMKRLNTLISVMNKDENINEKDNEISSDEEQNFRNSNINNIEQENNKNNNFNFKFKYNFPKRNNYNIKLKYPKNIVKEMISAATQNKPAPVYFNEP